MRRLLAPLGVAVAVSLGTLTANCGGKVVFDGVGSGGSADIASASSGMAAPPVCQAFCDVAIPAGCQTSSQQCLHDCTLDRQYGGPCLVQVDALIQCTVDTGFHHPGFCDDAFVPCKAERLSRDACTHPPGNCDDAACVTASAKRECIRICGTHVYETDAPALAHPFSCTCIVDGHTVGTCTDEVQSSCGCCDAIFAKTN